MACRFSLALVWLFATSFVAADIDVRDADAEMFPSNVRYDPSIPRPEEILGHKLGEEPVRHHKLVEYITMVAAASPRLSVEVIGYTHERRPILFVVATSAANRARLDDIKARHVALTEPSANQAITDDMPVVSWLNYGVHGAEESGMDASLPFVYYLAAAQDAKLDEILDNSVILITAIFNPDGHSARIAWLDSWGGERNITDPAHIEHNFSWGFARTNHYFFDLNRQWLLLTQPEPRAWMKKWHEWRPNLTVDYHEMGSATTYYFHPGIATRTNPLVPDEAERLMAEQVGTSEEFLDGEGRLYFHGERFDNYYIGKGSTFPLVNGGVGVLYEAAAALGREIETNGGLRTYRENIRKHFRTSIASIEAASAMRDDYLRYQKSFYENALRSADSQSTKAWVFSSPGDPVRLHKFADLLNYHRIKTYRPARNITVDDKTYAPNDALIVPVAQSQNTLIRSIFEFNTEFEDSTFYDVSTWTLPPAFGLQYSPLGRNFRANLVGAEYAPPMPVADAPDEASFAYVFEWGGYYAPRALQRVVESGLLARVATKPFSATTSNGVRQFSRGAIAVPFDRQTKTRGQIHALMKVIAAEDGVTVHAITSGRSANGTEGIEIGGPSFEPVSQPSTLLVMGDDVSLYDAGEIWHLLDYRMNMPLTIRDRDDLDGIKWNRYSHIVFPSGKYEGYEPGYLARLRQWVAEGGTLVAMGDAATWARANTLDWVDPMSDGFTAPEAEEDEEEPVERSDYANKSDEEAADVIGGAIFAADLDVTHPLGFGFATRAIHVHKNSKEPMEATKNPWGTVIEYSDNPVASGYVSDSNAETLAGTPALIAERSGAGAVVLFADNPNFRGYWYATNKLFLNSLFFSKAFNAPSGN
ncbi:MAG: M14 family zinc carboxypeptidase [Pseudomonadota bacterium]